MVVQHQERNPGVPKDGTTLFKNVLKVPQAHDLAEMKMKEHTQCS